MKKTKTPVLTLKAAEKQFREALSRFERAGRKWSKTPEGRVLMGARRALWKTVSVIREVQNLRTKPERDDIDRAGAALALAEKTAGAERVKAEKARAKKAKTPAPRKSRRATEVPGR